MTNEQSPTIAPKAKGDRQISIDTHATHSVHPLRFNSYLIPLLFMRKYTPYIIGSIVILMAFGLGIISNPANAENAPPAEVIASETWLDTNTPVIKKLQAQLNDLRLEQGKRVQVLSTFGYNYNWETLSLVQGSLTK